MPQPPKKITRRHPRSGDSFHPQRKRLFLQGRRWRFPSGLAPTELDARIASVRLLWQEHEQFAAQMLLVDPSTEFPDQYAVSDLLEAYGFAQTQSTEPHAPDWTMIPSLESQMTEQDRLLNLGRQILRYETRGLVQVVTQPAQWSPLALWTAEQIRIGIRPVFLPNLSTVFESICRGPLVEQRFMEWVRSLYRMSVGWPTDVSVFTPFKGLSLYDDSRALPWEQAVLLQQVLIEIYPSVPWAMHPGQRKAAVDYHQAKINQAAVTVGQLTERAVPPAEVTPIPGTLHEAINEFIKKRTEDFTVEGQFNGSGHHMIGLMENVRKRQEDVPLSLLDFGRCQEIYDFWRNRPLNLKNGKPLSIQHCSSHIGELGRFFAWLHKTPKYQWRRPSDVDLIDKTVKRLPSDRRSIANLELKVFNQEQLKLLHKHATLFERLILVWCLNCSHGAAEMGRVAWEDLHFDQLHPWCIEGLDVPCDQSDSWCGLLRPKTDVLGWWWLWPETVSLVRLWRQELEAQLKRSLAPTERILLSSTGSPLYRDSSRNAQTAFSNAWTRLLDRVAATEGEAAVPRLPFGTLRNQLSNWLGSDENQAVLASVALAHGIPHKGDKLLYRHYSNRPWSQFFNAQRKFRERHLCMFEP
jgi:hypothetical protein